MKTFTFFWLTGQREVLKGTDSAFALNNAGYSQGVIIMIISGILRNVHGI